MYPQPDDDLMHRALTAETELCEAEDQLAQACAIVAKQQERISFLESILLDMNARIAAAMDRKHYCDCVPGNTDDCPIHGVAHSSHECAAAEDACLDA